MRHGPGRTSFPVDGASTAHDEDRALGVVHHCAADRADDERCQPAVCARAYDDQRRVVAGLDEELPGRPLQQPRLDRHIGGRCARQRLVEDLLALAIDIADRDLDRDPRKLDTGMATTWSATTGALRSRASSQAHASAASEAADPSTPTTILRRSFAPTREVSRTTFRARRHGVDCFGRIERHAVERGPR